MRELLREEAEAFLATYASPRTSGLRINALKLSRAAYEERFGAAGDRIPWTAGGLYTAEEDRPGKHLHYYLGLYYIQEPSAMLPAELLGVLPGHRVLDLCAAPGGKSTQLAGKLAGRGVLVTNDNASERTKALAKNVERAGAANAIVMNEEPERLAEAFGAFFDRVLVDAPCSGEGMFRKDEEMVREWERHPDTVQRYAAMQRGILREAAKLVAPGGKLLYSTCTFSPEENEGSVALFLAEHPDFSVEKVEAPPEWGFGPGRPDWLTPEGTAGLEGERLASLAGTVRVWPHRSRGEGHYAALLVREGGAADAGAAVADKSGAQDAAETREAEAAGRDWSFPPLASVDGPADRRASVSASMRTPAAAKEKPRPGRAPQGGHGRGRDSGGKGRPAAGQTDAQKREMLMAFARDMLPDWRPSGRLIVRGDMLYLQPDGLPPIERLHPVRPGWLLGSASKHRFEPSQALAMGLRMTDAARSLRLSSDEDEALKYMKGESLHPDPSRITDAEGNPASGRGWALVCIDDCPAGWGRWDGALLKNELLPGWRWV
ncbi:RsmB/NOP family class I SAM-dependent RNA methyltransferase [Cohnella lubricantis]